MTSSSDCYQPDPLDLSRDELIDQWLGLFGSPPLKTLSEDLLLRGIAYQQQVTSCGGLTKSEAQSLIRIARKPSNHHLRTQQPGTRLYRTWKGVTHEVIVMEGYLSWQGGRYKSLSHVARAITGTRWSGPRFFGVA